jgi:galactose mutarotase-like enzyme
MRHTVSNSFFKIEVQQKGAELCSIKSLKTDSEYMWDANPDIWGSFAPVLFPIIGSLKNGVTMYKGKNYKIPKHGIIRHNNSIELKSKTANQLFFSLKYNDSLLKVYPFKFGFEISFKLTDNKIEVGHTITNLDKKPMLFSLGGHPAFKCPVNNNEKYSDYYLEFEHAETVFTHDLTTNGLVKNSTRPIVNKSKILSLSDDMFINDALIFKDLKSRKVTLKSKKSSYRLSVNFNGFNYLGIWAKPHANFICIEPWLGITDSDNSDGIFENKEGILEIGAGKSFNAKYTIKIEE